MVAMVALAASLTQVSIRDRIATRLGDYGMCPFEELTKDGALFDLFLKKLQETSVPMTRANENDVLFQQAVHPRHTDAYKNLAMFVEWKSPEGEKISPRTRVLINEPKFLAAEFDQDGNTYLNRLLLSHFFLSEQNALLCLDALVKRGKLNMKPNRFGQTPLMICVEAGWTQMFDRLMKLKPPIDAKDSQSRDVIGYLHYARPEVIIGVIACREVFTIELIAERLYERSNDVNKKRIFRTMNDYLENPYRLECGNYADEDQVFHLTWPVSKTPKKPKEKAPEFVLDRTNRWAPNLGVPPKIGSKGW